jgi:bifunctional DNase/RNase
MKREVKILGLSYSQSQVGSYVCVLSENNGHRKLPIIIKPQDAQTIALKIEGMKAPRPMTHDLFKTLSESFMIDCQEVFIYQVLEGVFYAKLSFNNGIDDVDIETTAGDAIALSLVYECPLYVSEEVLQICGVVTDDQGNLIADSEEEKEDRKSKRHEKKKDPVISLEDMKKMMEEAIQNEEYELAAQYSDKIKEMQGSI